jgi:hypothetical protein
MADSKVELKFVVAEAPVESMWKFRHTRAPIIKQESYDRICR